MTTYNSNTIPGLSLTTPTENASYPPEMNDAIREIKRALQYQYTVVSITDSDSPYTAVDTSSIILANASSGAITVNLPTAASISGRRYIIKKTDSSANAITIDGSGSETIDGATTYIITSQYKSIEIYSDGTNWQISGFKKSHHVLAKTANYTVLAAECDGMHTFTNEGAAGAVSLTLPTAVAGHRVSFIVDTAQNFIVIPGASDTITIAAATAGTDIRSATVGDSVELVAINATEWFALNPGTDTFAVN